jgi:hypothetical protein
MLSVRRSQWIVGRALVAALAWGGLGLVPIGQAAGGPRQRSVPDLPDLLERASDYVAQYEPRLGALVAREDYVQRVEGSGTATTRLSADVLLVRLDDKGAWLAFRNVHEVNGTPVPDRDERLARIFSSPTLEALRANQQRLVAESARYNAGGQGNINVPPFALMFLRAANIARFHFGGAGAEQIQGAAAWRVDYRETARPTIVKDQDLAGDAPAAGSFWLRASDAAVMRSLLRIAGRGYRSEIIVDYCAAPAVDILVPCTMSETFIAGRTRTRGEARYSDVRRFAVTTDLSIK